MTISLHRENASQENTIIRVSNVAWIYINHISFICNEIKAYKIKYLKLTNMPLCNLVVNHKQGLLWKKIFFF